MTPGTGIEGQIHRGLAGTAFSAGGLSIEADLSDRAAIRRLGDQLQAVGVRLARMKPVVVISWFDWLWREAVGEFNCSVGMY